jgi:hypothetical protein
MRPPFLLICAGFFNGISTLGFLPTLAVCALPIKSRLLWPVAIVLFPLTIPFLCVYSLAQVISSLCAFTFHQQAGIRATVQSDGLHLDTKPAPQVILWHDINLIRRVYERAFGDYKTRFRDNSAYQIMLKSGESFYIDFVDETALRSQAGEQGATTEGFDSHLSASEFEPVAASDGN